MEKQVFCIFLNYYNKELHNLALKVDELLYIDTTSAVIHGRKFAENLLKDVYKQEKSHKDERYMPKLYDLIQALYHDGVFEREVQKNLDFLRFHGNQAAHGKEGNSQIIALQVHRKVHQLAGWYVEVYGSPDFETPDYMEPKPSKGVDEEYIQNLISEHIRKFTEDNREKEIEQDQQFTIPKYLSNGNSYLMREVNRLKASSQEALENVGNFSAFKDYLHVEREVQFNLEEELNEALQSNKRLILLAGSVGDGKSHLLSYLQKKRTELIGSFEIINDATESNSPDKSSMETLREKLKGFSDQEYQLGQEKVILAINLGVLNNFINYEHDGWTFDRLKEFVDSSKVFTDEITEVFKEGNFSLINFSDYQPFELSENKVYSSYFGEIMKKITKNTSGNPFYQAYNMDLQNDIYTAVHMNYELLSEHITRTALNKLICYLILEDKVVVSTRTFFNFIADILIPTETNLDEIKIQNMTEFERVEYSLPSLLFDRRGRSDLIDRIQKYDPIHERSQKADEIINTVYSSNDFNKAVKQYIRVESYKKIFDPINRLLADKENNLEEESFQSLTKFTIRVAYLTDPVIQEELDNPAMRKYINFLYGFNRLYKTVVKEIYESIKNAVFMWKGSPKKGYVYTNNMSEKYRLAQKLDYNPKPPKDRKKPEDVLKSFTTTLIIPFSDQSASKDINLEMDYSLFKLLYRVSNGYRPNSKDYENGLAFITFMDQLISSSKSKDLIIHYRGEKDLYSLEKDFIGSFVFEKVE